MKYDEIVYEPCVEGVARLTLNRPEALNAYTVTMMRECADAVVRYAENDSDRVLVVTGAGRGFCSGGDIRSPAEPEMARQRQLGHATVMREGFHSFARAIRTVDKPVIAMVNGPAMAGGLSLALLCDIRIASDQAMFGDPSGAVGLLPDDGGSWLFPRAMGMERALRMTLLGETFDADQALALGLVSEVVASEALEARTMELATRLAARAPLAVRLAKRLMTHAQEETMSQALDEAELAVIVTNDSHDVSEGLAALAEKRTPRFEGR